MPSDSPSLLSTPPAATAGAPPPSEGAVGATGDAPAPAPSGETGAAPAETPKAPDPNVVSKDNPFKPEEIKFSDAELKVDPEMATALTAIVNEHGIPRNAVAALIDLQQKAMLANSEAGSRDWAKMQEEWTSAVMKDPEIGGNNWPKVQTQIGGMIDKFGSPELRQAFDLTGAGNNPHVVRFMSKIAAVLSESGFVSSNSSGSGERTAAEILYPNQGK